jgi:hypothetical protein
VRTKPAIAFVGPLLLLASLSCHHSDDPICLEFHGAASPSPGSVTCRDGAGSNCELVAVDVIVRDVPNIFTVDLALTFDPALAGYEGMSADGSILNSDGTEITVFEDYDPQLGKVTVTMARLGLGSGGIDAIGEQFLIRFYFSKAAETGSCALAFTTTRMFSGVFPPEMIDGVEWSGGTLIIP